MFVVFVIISYCISNEKKTAVLDMEGSVPRLTLGQDAKRAKGRHSGRIRRVFEV